MRRDMCLRERPGPSLLFEFSGMVLHHVSVCSQCHAAGCSADHTLRAGLHACTQIAVSREHMLYRNTAHRSILSTVHAIALVLLSSCEQKIS